jgi:hypothetical protein
MDPVQPLADGALYCWGRDDFAQLGQGETSLLRWLV